MPCNTCDTCDACDACNTYMRYMAPVRAIHVMHMMNVMHIKSMRFIFHGSLVHLILYRDRPPIKFDTPVFYAPQLGFI